MKISRVQLKGLIKECLVEILSEGLGGNLAESVQGRSAKQSMPARTSAHPRVNVKQLVEQVSTKNAVLDGLLAETASTSLQSMLANDPSLYGESNHDQVGPADRTGGLSPEQLFGDEISSSWLNVLDRIGK